MTDGSKKLGFDLTEDELTDAGDAAESVRAFRLLVFVGQRLRYLLDQRLREDGLTTQQGVLLTLVRALGRPTLGDVTKAMSTSHQNAKQIALGLERKGLLTITADKTDARVRRLEPTELGLAGWTDRNRDDFAVIGEWFSALSSKDQGHLVRLLATLARSLSSIC
jgi:DNA-binding MarR family transcriptional regulator